MLYDAEYYYYSFDFNTEALVEIDEPEINNYPNYTIIDIEDEAEKNSVVEKINSKFKTNYSLSSELNSDGNINVILSKIEVNGKTMYNYFASTGDIKKRHGFVNEKTMYNYFSDNTYDGMEYLGYYNDSFDFLFERYDYSNEFKDAYTWPEESGSLLIQENPSTDNSTLYIIKDCELVNKCKVDSTFLISNESLFNVYYFNDKIILRDRLQNICNEYSIINGELVKTLSIPMSIDLRKPYDKFGNMWTYFVEGSKAYIAKVENGQAIKKYEVPNFVNDEDLYEIFEIYAYAENNIIISRVSHVYDENIQGYTSIPNTVFIQNETTVTPDEPSTEDTNKPDNNISKPGENTVNGISKVEINKIKANSVNNITLDKNTTKFEVSITDIDSLKIGTGSLQITSSNNIYMNIPFNTIDKSILENAKAVKLKYNVLENTDITRDIKGLKKVFNFELIVEKESGNISIHNFADGVVEIKISLTTEELNGLNKDKLSVFYYNEITKKFEVMETRIEENNVIFNTSHFSNFIISEKNIIDGNTLVQNLPQTGTPISSSVIMVIALILIGSGITLTTKNKFIK